MKTWKKTGAGVSLALSAMIAAVPACSSSSGKGRSTSTATGGSSTGTATGGSGTGTVSWSCSAKGRCPNDPAPTAGQIQDCESSLSDPDCGSAFMAQAVCNFSNPQCNDAGMSGGSASCMSADVAWANCMLGDAGTD